MFIVHSLKASSVGKAKSKVDRGIDKVFNLNFVLVDAWNNFVIIIQDPRDLEGFRIPKIPPMRKAGTRNRLDWSTTNEKAEGKVDCDIAKVFKLNFVLVDAWNNFVIIIQDPRDLEGFRIPKIPPMRKAGTRNRLDWSTTNEKAEGKADCDIAKVFNINVVLVGAWNNFLQEVEGVVTVWEQQNGRGMEEEDMQALISVMAGHFLVPRWYGLE